MKQSKLFFLVVTGALMLCVLSAAIAAPILCRPFYYAHVSPLDLSAQTPWSAGEIRAAYDEMMDFCIFGAPFGTGVLRWSEAGMAHFADCARLFRLDFLVLALSALTLLVCSLLRRRGLHPVRPLGRGCAFWAGSSLALLSIVISALAALNFNAAFVFFHRLFFPGKSNWIFDPVTDQIILVMPQVFFRNCAILAVALLFLGCFALILWDLRSQRRRSKRKE